ncbi:MAG: type II toxin-antitoxin system VapC family toxin [Acidimicrobiaceae bacterium]|nr:type II toxin-antitoxin system VapC family toxin [Acidimicrobiaceae bacterium]
MIAYFDTSAFVPLIIDEPSSGQYVKLWNETTRAVSVRLLYAEARAALAMAERLGRLNRSQLATAVEQLDTLTSGLDWVEITAHLVRVAGDLAERRHLRGYDAIHLAAACSVGDGDTVFISGDRQLLSAAASEGLLVAGTH